MLTSPNSNFPYFLFRIQQGHQRLGVVAVQTGTRLCLQIQPDGIRDSFAKPCRPGQKLVTVIVVAGIQTGVAQVDICQYIAGLELDGFETPEAVLSDEMDLG